MPGNYNLKRFLKQAPNKLLQRYLADRGLGRELKWASLKEGSVQTLFRIVDETDEGLRRAIELEFQRVHTMADEAGTLTIIEEANDPHHDL